jgi:hypothetical protein
MFWQQKFSSLLEKPPLARRQTLAGVPIFHAGVRMVENSNLETITLVLTIKRRTDFLGKFQPPQWERKIELDELGSFVVRQINGKRTALELVDAFVERFKVNRREGELSTMAFLKSLIERGVLYAAIPTVAEANAS